MSGVQGDELREQLLAGYLNSQLVFIRVRSQSIVALPPPGELIPTEEARNRTLKDGVCVCVCVCVCVFQHMFCLVGCCLFIWTNYTRQFVGKNNCNVSPSWASLGNAYKTLQAMLTKRFVSIA